MNISDLDVDRNFILSSSQLIDVRYAIRVLLLNLQTRGCELAFRPSTNNSTKKQEIEALEKLLDDISRDKVKLANFIDNK